MTEFTTLSDIFYGIDDLWEKRVQVVKMDTKSDKECEITLSMIKDLLKGFENENMQLALSYEWKFNRPKPEGKELVKSKHSTLIDAAFLDAFKNLLADVKKDIMNKEEKVEEKTYTFPLVYAIPFFQ